MDQCGAIFFGKRRTLTLGCAASLLFPPDARWQHPGGPPAGNRRVNRSGQTAFMIIASSARSWSSHPSAPGKLQPSVGADPVIGVHAEKGLIARLGELWTCPAHPVTVLHKADRL